jgi:hypothetical protein
VEKHSRGTRTVFPTSGAGDVDINGQNTTKHQKMNLDLKTMKSQATDWEKTFAKSTI